MNKKTLSKTIAPENLQTTAINALRFLSADAVQQTNSGHPTQPADGRGCYR